MIILVSLIGRKTNEHGGSSPQVLFAMLIIASIMRNVICANMSLIEFANPPESAAECRINQKEKKEKKIHFFSTQALEHGTK